MARNSVYLFLQGTRKEWQDVFNSLGLIHIVSAGIFVIFCSSELQSWASFDNSKMKTKSEPKCVPKTV